ncbi:MAG: GNAT family N-acetyltransferase [Rhizobiaceae bacterium]|jgi:RimJ/RimL family protein N-acetyltransferase|nr:GNAT family N-acetyltransferase [Rhizobiaceae bacterium]
MLKQETGSSEGLGIACEILTTKDLVLRPPRKEDAADIASLANNINVASMLASMPYPYFDTHAEEFIEKISNPSVTDCHYAITHAETGAVMGICSLHGPGHSHGLPYVGYWLGEEFWGNGYATQAARGLIDLFFKAGTRDALIFSVLTVNAPSRRVIEKCGASLWKEEQLYSEFFRADRTVQHYRITRESWMGAVSS